MTKHEVQQCDIIAARVEYYRSQNNFLTSPCWLDDWCYGYFCALRDGALITQEQWQFLCETFDTQMMFKGEGMI